MIKEFRHKGLKQFFETGSRKGIQAAHAPKLRIQLASLNVAQSPNDLANPGWQLHPLKGKQAGQWAISVNGNWRLTFAFDDEDVVLLDYQDYH